MSSCGRYLVAATKTSVVLFDATQLDTATEGQELMVFDAPTSMAGLEFSPDGEQLACADADGDLYVISTGKDRDNDRTRKSWRASEYEVTDFSFTHDGEYLATASRDGTIRIWHVATQKLVRVFVDESIVYCVEFASDGKTLAAGNDSGQVKVWDTGFLAERGDRR